MVVWSGLGETVGKEYTAIGDLVEAALLFAVLPTDAPAGQSRIVSHGWSMA